MSGSMNVLSNNSSKFHVIIRSSDERTISLCQKIAEEIFESHCILINEKPFAKALKVSLLSGIDSKKEWLICVDADVLLYKDGVEKLAQKMLTTKENVFEIQGRIVDKFFPTPKKGGIHAYRIKHLPKAIPLLDQIITDSTQRPEKTLIMKMDSMGYKHQSIDIIIGTHDFEQYNQDIYRKGYFHAQKHVEHLPSLIPFWKKNALHDSDFAIVLKGLAAGIEGPTLEYGKTSSIDKERALNDLKIWGEKNELTEDQQARQIILERCKESQSFLNSKNALSLKNVVKKIIKRR